jgi:hypothetical protein
MGERHSLETTVTLFTYRQSIILIHIYIRQHRHADIAPTRLNQHATVFAACMPDSGAMWDCDCGQDNHAENADKEPDWLSGHGCDLTRHLTAPPSSVTT